MLNHINVLLINPNPNHPIHSGSEYINHKEDFAKKAREWVKNYANINDFENEEKQGIHPGVWF